jgi:hypothetical protein
MDPGFEFKIFVGHVANISPVCGIVDIHIFVQHNKTPLKFVICKIPDAGGMSIIN